MTANHRALDAADIMLIEKVKATPTLYDSSNPDFKFAYRKEQLWESVAAALGMTAVDARKRWTCLRDRYSRELKQMRLHPEKSEYGHSDFFRQMDFLRKFVRKRRERRRAETRYKYDSSWDGSNDNTTRSLNKSDPIHTEEDACEGNQDQYNAKVEVSIAETESFSEYMEETEISNPYEEYEEQSRMDNTAYSVNKYETSAGPETPQNSTLADNVVATPNVIPITFLNHASSSRGDNASTNCVLPAPYRISNAPQQQSTCDPSIVASCGDSSIEDDFFCKTIGSYLRQLSRRHKIKAKVEMFQILEKYIDIEENPGVYRGERKG